MIGAAHRLAETLPPLLVSARQVAGAVLGVHGRRRPGPGETFWQFRAARPGDSGRSIDWRQSARSDHLQVRETEWSAAHTLQVWCDPAASLNWHSLPTLPMKSQRAMVLALALSILVLRAGERVCALGRMDPVSGEGRLEQVALGLSASGSLLPSPVVQAHHGAVLVSDFLQPLEHWQQVVKALAAQGIRGHLLQVLDPAELDFPYDGRVTFRALDTQPDLTAPKAQGWRTEYQARMTAHIQGLTDLCNGLGWTHLVHRTDHSPQLALLALHQRLALGAG